VTINGQNFGATPAENSVELTVAGSPLKCQITSATSTQIVCQIQLGDSSSGSLLAVVTAHRGSSTQTIVGSVGTGDSSLAPNGLSSGASAGIAVAVVVTAFVVALIIFLVWRRRQQKKLEEQLRKVYEVSDEFANLFNIKSDEISLIHKLGEGSYGGMSRNCQFLSLRSGLTGLDWTGLTGGFFFLPFVAVFLGTYKKKHVAVKKLSGSALGQASEFFREASLMMSLKVHPNIVRCDSVLSFISFPQLTCQL